MTKNKAQLYEVTWSAKCYIKPVTCFKDSTYNKVMCNAFQIVTLVYAPFWC